MAEKCYTQRLLHTYGRFAVQSPFESANVWTAKTFAHRPLFGSLGKPRSFRIKINIKKIQELGKTSKIPSKFRGLSVSIIAQRLGAYVLRGRCVCPFVPVVPASISSFSSCVCVRLMRESVLSCPALNI